MDKKRKESKLSRKDLDRKPKYIGKLLAAADRRKKDNERRIERQIQKERETEGEEFKDKDSFVTNAYKKKLEEMKELEEQEKREAYLESIGDVTKQVNLDGFYRHLYDQKVNQEEKAGNEEETDQKPDVSKPIIEERSNDTEAPLSKNVNNKSERQYRSRKDSDNSDHQDDVKKEHLPSNLDADSDFSIDSSDSEEEKEKVPTAKEPNGATATPLETNPEVKVEANIENKKRESDTEIEQTPKKPKIDIWKKRTVGEVFDAALIRYFERKATAAY